MPKPAQKSDLDRTDLAKDKTGVFTGAYAINPVNDANGSRSGSPTTYSSATAPAPSWPFPATTNATTSSHASTIFRSSRWYRARSTPIEEAAYTATMTACWCTR